MIEGFMFWAGMVVGAFVAQWLTERRWRNNARDYRGIESGGELFKVMYREEHFKLLERANRKWDSRYD